MKYVWGVAILVLITCLAACKSRGADKDELAEGKVLFERHCAACHGTDGKLGLNEAKDLTVSELTIEERVALMKNGKNLMTPFEGILTEEEMHKIATYAMTLKE